MCFICNNQAETLKHIFFNFSFATKLWSWLCGKLNLNVQITSANVWEACDKAGSPQWSFTITIDCIFLRNVIWNSRNSSSFNGKFAQFESMCSLLLTQLQLSNSRSKLSYYHNWMDFVDLKALNVHIRPPSAPFISVVLWCPPFYWLKCNVVWAYTSTPS